MIFELRKNHKYNTKSSWKKSGIKFTDEDFEFIYGVYITAENCMLCDKEFTKIKDRCMDHDHSTGEFRYAGYDRKLQDNNKSGTRFLSDYTSRGYESYHFQHRPTKFTKMFSKKKYSKEEVIEFIENYIDKIIIS